MIDLTKTEFTTAELDNIEKLKDKLVYENKRYNHKIIACQNDPFFIQEDQDFSGEYTTPRYIDACKCIIAANDLMLSRIDEILATA